MKKIIFGFSKHKNFNIVSELIVFISGCPFSHCYVKIKDDWIDESLIYQASGLAVNVETNESFSLKSAPVAEIEIDISLENYKSLKKYLFQKLGTPYSIASLFFLGIRLLLSKININIKNPIKDGPASVVCSEFAADILNFIKPALNLDSDNIIPADLYNILIKGKS